MRLAISTCPNDTFAFDAILRGRVTLPGGPWDIRLCDIQQLNDGFRRGDFDVAKVSFAAAAGMSPAPWVLDAGAAIGYGVGPLLLGPPPGVSPARNVTLCPGPDTTATALLSMFHPDAAVEHVVFSDIMPALRRGRASAGVCIHEGRFTYEEAGLTLIDDLGRRWHDAAEAPLPLGGIVARHGIDAATVTSVSDAIARSVAAAIAEPAAALPTMRRYAKELDGDVLDAHVDLYVNSETVGLTVDGRHALREFWRRVEAGGPPRFLPRCNDQPG